MAGFYDKRTAELLGGFHDKVTDGRELAWYLPRLTEYTKKCDALLGDLWRELSRFDVRDGREAQQWASLRDKRLAEAVSARPDLSKFSDVPSAGLLAFHATLQIEEGVFLGGMKTSNAGDEVDRIAAIAKNLQEKTANLETLWKQTLDRDGGFERQAEAVAREIAQIIEEAIDKAAENNRTLVESFAELVKINDAIPDGLDNLTSLLPGKFGLAVGVVSKGLAASTFIAAKMMERVVERSNRLKDAFRKEANLLVVFSETRKDVETFVRTTNLEQAKAAHRQADQELQKLAASMKTSGQKADLSIFRTKVLEVLAKVLDEAERHHDAFVAKHKSKFFGPLGDPVKEQLLQTGKWTGLQRGIATRALHLRLEELYSKNLFSVTASKLQPDVRAYLERELRADFDKAMKLLLDIDRKVMGQPPENEIEAMRKVVEARLR